MRARTESRRKAIIDAAASVFLEMGYEGAAMNEVARRAGGSKTTLYSYFTSKDELFAAVVECYAMSHLSSAVSMLNGDSQDVQSLRCLLLRFAEGVLTVVTNDTTALAVYRMVVGESGRSKVGQIFHESGPQQCVDALSEVLSTAMRRGILLEENASLRASQLLSLITVECEQRVYQIAPEPLTLARIKLMAASAIEMFMGGAVKRL